MTITLPALYDRLTPETRRAVRERYVAVQGGNCMHCGSPLSDPVPDEIKRKRIDWRRFPPNFLKHPVHLQHCHKTGLTEGAVHSYCNAVLWQYYGR